MGNDNEFESALFRFSLISPLLHCEDGMERRRIVRELCSKEMDIPHSNKKRVTAKTIENYLKRYREEGFDGLKRDVRSDRDTVKSVSEEVVRVLMELKKEQPARSSRQIIRLVHSIDEHRDVSLKERTVSRILRNKGLTRKDLKPKKIHRGFEMDTINDLWETDISEGLFLKRLNRMTHCFAFIDDFSRVITHAQFYLDEKLPRLEDCFKKAILKRGIPRAIYADNGRVFVSNHFKRICAELGVHLMHHLPYSPQSKGKIERFFLRMKKEFLLEAQGADIQSLEELNSHFQAWLEVEYHRKEHHGIGAAPMDRFTRALASTKLRAVESMEEITETFLYREKRKVHKKSGVIKVSGNEYQVTDASLLDLEVDVRFDPYDMARLFIYRDGKYVQTALPQSLKNRYFNSIPEETPAAEKTVRQSSIDFFARLKKKEQEISRKESQRIDFTKVNKEN